MWARKKIAQLDDYGKLFNEDIKDKVIALGLKYNLATNYTSFVAVDESVVNKSGKVNTIKQPVPMPKNVNNSAVGAEVKVVAKTRFKKSFSIHIDDKLLKTTERKVKMEFKVLYSKLVTQYLKEFESLRIKFNAKGEIVTVEVFKNGKWMYSPVIFNEFSNSTINALKINRSITLTLKK